MTEVIVVESSDEVVGTHAALTNSCRDFTKSIVIEDYPGLGKGIKMWEPLTQEQHDAFYSDLRKTIADLRAKGIEGGLQVGSSTTNNRRQLSSKQQKKIVANRKQQKLARRNQRR